MQGLRRGDLGRDRSERDWGDGIRRRGRIWSERWRLEALVRAKLSEAMARGAPVDRERRTERDERGRNGRSTGRGNRRRRSRLGLICWSREELVSLVDEESEDELDRGEASGGVWLVGLDRGE